MENIPVTETGKEMMARRSAKSDKCPDSDVCLRVDVGESCKTGTEMIPCEVLDLDLVSHTKVGEDQEWSTAQDMLTTSEIYHQPNYGSESDKCPDSDVCPRVDVGESSKTGIELISQLRLQHICKIYHPPNYGSESDKCPDSESESDECPDSDTRESWETGLFDCHKNKTIAAVVTFCPCVAFGHIAEVLDEGEMTCPIGSFIYLLMLPLLCSQWIIGSKYRKKLRGKFNLVEAPYEDWASHIFCQYCSLCQEYRELQIRGLDPSQGWKGIHARQQGIQQRSQDPLQCPPRTQAMSK